MPLIVPKDRANLDFIIAQQLNKDGMRANLNGIDVSGIQDFSMLFASKSFRGDVSKWDTSSATNMHGMFAHSDFDGDVSAWDVSRVKDMGMMFERTPFTGDLSNWNVASVMDFRSMFSDGIYDGDLSRWTLHPGAETSFMFSLPNVLLTPSSLLRLPQLPIKEDMHALFGYKDEPYDAWCLHSPIGPNHWQEVIKMVKLDETNNRVEASGKRRPIQWTQMDPDCWAHPEMVAKWHEVNAIHDGLGLGVAESARLMASASHSTSHNDLPLPALLDEGLPV